MTVGLESSVVRRRGGKDEATRRPRKTGEGNEDGERERMRGRIDQRREMTGRERDGRGAREVSPVENVTFRAVA